MGHHTWQQSLLHQAELVRRSRNLESELYYDSRIEPALLDPKSYTGGCTGVQLLTHFSFSFPEKTKTLLKMDAHTTHPNKKLYVASYKTSIKFKREFEVSMFH